MLQESIFILSMSLGLLLIALAVRVLNLSFSESRLTAYKVKREMGKIVADHETHEAHMALHKAEQARIELTMKREEKMKDEMPAYMAMSKKFMEEQLKQMKDATDKPWEKDGP